MSENYVVTFPGSNKSTYSCPNGHSFTFHGVGNFSMFQFTYQDKDGKLVNKDYNYCPYCWGEWAEKQWPLIKEEPSGETSA